jgi:hypothetical protein
MMPKHLRFFNETWFETSLHLESLEHGSSMQGKIFVKNIF